MGLLSVIACGMWGGSLPLHEKKSAVPVSGCLSTASPASRGGEQLAAFHSGLRQAGYTEGENVRIEYRWANDDYGRLRALAEELVALRVAVIVAAGGPVSALVARDVTKEIPICFTTVTEPVKSGLVKSLNRPGGNATGTAGLTSELDPKRLELLHEMKPTAAVIGVLINPNRPRLETQLPELRAAAGKMKLKLQLQEATASRDIDIEVAFQGFASQRLDALLVTADSMFNNRRAQVLALAARYSLPAIYQCREFVTGRRPTTHAPTTPQPHPPPA